MATMAWSTRATGKEAAATATTTSPTLPQKPPRTRTSQDLWTPSTESVETSPWHVRQRTHPLAKPIRLTRIRQQKTRNRETTSAKPAKRYDRERHRNPEPECAKPGA